MSNDNILDYLYSVQCEDCPLGECCKTKQQNIDVFIAPCAKLITAITIETL